MMSRTLVLTPWMAPVRVVSWMVAIRLLYEGKVDVLEEYDEVVCSPSVAWHIPSVIRLRKPISSHKKGVKFSRINVMTRDGFTCQFCGRKLPMKDLSYDHVIPRKQGGKTVWENIVTACAGPHGCNSRKAGKTPEQAGMRLLKKPVRPKTLPLTPPIINSLDIPESWLPYLKIGPARAIA